MRLTRIYHPAAVSLLSEFVLPERASHYLLNVMRSKQNDPFILFDGFGKRYAGHITALEKKAVRVILDEQLQSNTVSPLALQLGQVISRGERMDWTIQKATELGVHSITPLMSERCGVKLEGDRLEKKRAHWQSIIISACEQCGQDTVPILNPIQTIHTWLATVKEEHRFVLAPTAVKHLNQETLHTPRVALLVGSEGGLTDQEIECATKHEFAGIALGPRILRTETAAMTAIAILQFLKGDF